MMFGFSSRGLEQTGIEDERLFRFDLAQNRPNPFNPRTMIRFSLDAEAPARLIVYDVKGRVLRTLVDERKSAGSHSVVWDGRDDAGHRLTSGVYLYRLESGERMVTRKLMLLQ